MLNFFKTYYVIPETISSDSLNLNLKFFLNEYSRKHQRVYIYILSVYDFPPSPKVPFDTFDTSVTTF